MSTPTTDDINDRVNALEAWRLRIIDKYANCALRPNIDVAIKASFEPTLNTHKVLPKSPEIINRERQSNLIDIRSSIEDQIKLLPSSTPELMMHYEKLYVQTIIDDKVLKYGEYIARNAENREKYKQLNPDGNIHDVAMRLFDEEDAKYRELERKQREADMNPDWSQYFLDRKETDYCVYEYFNK